MIATRGWGVGKKGDLKHRKESKENVSKGNNVIKVKNYFVVFLMPYNFF